MNFFGGVGGLNRWGNFCVFRGEGRENKGRQLLVLKGTGGRERKSGRERWDLIVSSEFEFQGLKFYIN